MDIRERVEQGSTIVELEGRFDFSARKEFKAVMERVQQAGGQHVVFNLEKVTFVDSSALGSLVVAHQNFKLKQGRISLLKPQSYVKQILDLANIPKMIPVFENLQDALAGKVAGTAVAH